MEEERKDYKTVVEKFDSFFKIRKNDIYESSIEGASKAEKLQSSILWPSTIWQKIVTTAT